MDWIGIAALITAVAGGIVSLVTVYIQLSGQISKAKHDNHAEIVAGYQDLLARSHAQAEVFKEEIREAREEGRKSQEEARTFFSQQLREVTAEFTATLREERLAARREAAENRKAMGTLVEQNAEEHRAIVASIEDLRQKIEGRTDE